MEYFVHIDIMYGRDAIIPFRGNIPIGCYSQPVASQKRYTMEVFFFWYQMFVLLCIVGVNSHSCPLRYQKMRTTVCFYSRFEVVESFRPRAFC